VNPDVADAVSALAREGVLPAEKARLFGRVARGELVSVHFELRLAAYLGVLLVMGGVGVLVKENLQRIGPLGITLALTFAVAGCFAWVIPRAQPFTWGESRGHHAVFDYILLLGALLAAADLAYVETQFTPLGTAWAWHLLFVAALYAALAFRFDSRALFSLSLTTFAAWRGVSAATLEVMPWSRSSSDLVRLNALVCGVVFLFLGAMLRRREWKAHFEPVAVHLGWLLLLAAPASGLTEYGDAAQVYAVVLAVVGLGLVGLALLRRRFSLFAFGLIGAYVGVSAVVVHNVPDALAIWWFAFTSLFIVLLLIVLYGRMREEE
jgi:hypothetical protein